MASLGSSVPGPSASTSTASQHDSARPISNWIPPHLRGQMAAHGGQSGPHGSHQKTHQGTASCNSGTAGLSADDFQESRSLTLEWRLNNLKSVFDSSRGDAKSRCIKSGYRKYSLHCPCLPLTPRYLPARSAMYAHLTRF